MDYRVHITYGGLLGDEPADRLLDALQAHAGSFGPVISEDTSAGTFTITATITFGERGMHPSALTIAQGDISGALGTAGIDAQVLSAEVELVDGPAAAAA